MKKRSIGIAVISLIIVVIFALLGIWFKGGFEGKSSGSFAYPPTKVAIAIVTKTETPRIIRGIGQLEAKEQVAISSESSGQITDIAFESGDWVEKGDRLVQLNDAIEQAEKTRLEAQLRNAEIQLRRFTLLAQENASSKEKRDNALADRDMVMGDLKKIEAQIAQKSIRAPFSGKLGIRRVYLGDYLQNGQTIINLVNPSHFYLNFSLDEKAAAELQIGQRVHLAVDAYPDKIYLADITTIDPMIDASRTIQIQAAVISPADERLQAGMFAKVEVIKADERILTVPETAITYTAYGDTLFVVETNDSGDSIAKRRSVVLGEHWDGRVEIKKGINEDEQVITSGQMKLQEGARVEALPVDTLNSPDLSQTDHGKEAI